MKLINKSPRNYMAFDTILEAGKVLDIADSKTINILKNTGVQIFKSTLKFKTQLHI